MLISDNPPQPSPQRKRAAAVKESVRDIHTYPNHISNDMQGLIHTYISNDIQYIYPMISIYIQYYPLFQWISKTYSHIYISDVIQIDIHTRYPCLDMSLYTEIHMDNIGYVMDISWESVRISMQDISTRYPCLDMFRCMDT